MIFTFTFTFGIQSIVPVFKNLPPFQTVARHDDRPLKKFFSLSQVSFLTGQNIG